MKFSAYISFFLLIGIFLGCSEDESIDSSLNNSTSLQNGNVDLDKDFDGIRVETIPFSISKHKNELEQKLGEFSNNHFNQDLASFSESENENNPILNGLHILEDSVVYAEFGNKHTYTFATYRETENDFIENLVLKNNLEEDYDAYLFQYRKNNDEIIVHRLEEYQSGLLFSESSGGGCGIQATVTPCSSNKHHKGNMGSWGECTANVGPTIKISFLCENDSGNGGSTYVLNSSNYFCVGCESSTPTTSTNNGSPTTGDGNDNSDVQTQDPGSGSTANGTTHPGAQETGEPNEDDVDIVTQQFLPNEPEEPEEPEPPSPCEQIAAQLANPEFTERLKELHETAVSESFNNGGNQNEIGYVQERSGWSEKFEGEGVQGRVNLTTNVDSFGWMHSHPVTDVLSILDVLNFLDDLTFIRQFPNFHPNGYGDVYTMSVGKDAAYQLRFTGNINNLNNNFNLKQLRDKWREVYLKKTQGNYTTALLKVLVNDIAIPGLSLYQIPLNDDGTPIGETNLLFLNDAGTGLDPLPCNE